MGAISDKISNAWRDYRIAGVPASGENEPVKAEIRDIGPAIEAALGVSLGAVTVAYSTRSALNADLAHPAGSTGLVYADATDANNDLYTKVGSSGSGSWTNTGALHSIVDGLTADIIDEAAASAAAAAASSEEVADRAGVNSRADSALSIEDDNGRGYVLFDGDVRLRAERLPSVPTRDPALIDLLAAVPDVIWRGRHRFRAPYAKGDMVLGHTGQVWYCHAGTTGVLAPDADASHWTEFPLIDAATEQMAFDDDFSTNPGAAAGRAAGGGYSWAVTGTGGASAVVGSSYMTGAGLVYYGVTGITGGITEIGKTYLATAAPFVDTFGVSNDDGFLGTGLSPMIHSNLLPAGVAGSTYWQGGSSNVALTYKFDWSNQRTRPYQANDELEYMVRIRGAWLLRYVDGVLRYVELSDKIGEILDGASAFFIENHPSAVTNGNGDSLGGERHTRLWVKTAS